MMKEPDVSAQSASESPKPIELKDPVMAAFLAWLIPGLGHLYQGRIAKGILFLVGILGIFMYGVYLGGDREVGWGRVVYMSFRPEDQRLHFLCQVGVGLPAMPAVIQAVRVRSERAPLWGCLMAPPRLPSDRSSDRPTLDDLHKRLHHYFELGTLYTMIAGLLNILAIYDAWAGPVLEESVKEEKEEKDSSPAEVESSSGGSDVKASESGAEGDCASKPG